MMGGRTWDDWIDEYAASHQNTVNNLMHIFGIPMIAASLVLLPTLFIEFAMWKIIVELFVIGWALQFIGHFFERKPPEFLKDRRFLLVGLRWWFKKVFG